MITLPLLENNNRVTPKRVTGLKINGKVVNIYFNDMEVYNFLQEVINKLNN